MMGESSACSSKKQFAHLVSNLSGLNFLKGGNRPKKGKDGSICFLVRLEVAAF